MKKLEQRNNIRIFNQIRIIDLLKKEKMTLTTLAEHLNISFTAVSHIVEDMVNQKIVKFSSKKSVNARGRIPTFVELNTDIGVVCAIDLSSKDIQIIIASLDGKVLGKDEIQNAVFISKEHLNIIEDKIKNLLASPALSKYKLLSICISSPGLIRRDTQEYVNAYRIIDFAKMNPVLHFSNAFGVNVEMHNDIKIACLAELKFGAFPTRPFNGIFVHIGSSSGLSFVINGKIYEGTNGFSGEMPLFVGNDPVITADTNYNWRLFSFWEMQNRINEYKGIPIINPKNGVDITKIVEDYKRGDKYTVDAVEESCKRNALTLIALSTLLDIEYIVIEGPVQMLGDSYIQKLSRYAMEFSEYDIRTRIVPSKVGIDGSTVGACYQASSMYFLEKIESVTKKRIKVDNVELYRNYKEI